MQHPSRCIFDAYRGTLKRTRRLWGDSNPLQRIAMAIARQK
jgi:hypothetical protein